MVNIGTIYALFEKKNESWSGADTIQMVSAFPATFMRELRGILGYVYNRGPGWNIAHDPEIDLFQSLRVVFP